MIARARLRYVRGSARKIRLVIDLIRGLDVVKAMDILPGMNKGSTVFIQKLLNSAVSNAKVKGVDKSELYISKVTADEASRWKRFRAGSFGRANEILKRTSHVTIELDLKQKHSQKISRNMSSKKRK